MDDPRIIFEELIGNLVTFARNTRVNAGDDIASIIVARREFELRRAEHARPLVEAIVRYEPRSGIFFLPETHADVTHLVTDLLVANDGWQDATEERGSLFLAEARQIARTVGQKLHDTDGMEAMTEMWRIINALLSGVAASELSAAWNGIGDWRD